MTFARTHAPSQMLDMARSSRVAMAAAMGSEPSRGALIAKLTVKRERKGEQKVGLATTPIVSAAPPGY